MHRDHLSSSDRETACVTLQKLQHTRSAARRQPVRSLAEDGRLQVFVECSCRMIPPSFAPLGRGGEAIQQRTPLRARSPCEHKAGLPRSRIFPSARVYSAKMS